MYSLDERIPVCKECCKTSVLSDDGRIDFDKFKDLIRNIDKPLYFDLLFSYEGSAKKENSSGKKKFIFCYDPARNFDGSILSIFQIINDKEVGYILKLENVIPMVDQSSKKKTPLPMPAQLEIIKELIIKYNGERAAKWKNIDFYIGWLRRWWNQCGR